MNVHVEPMGQPATGTAKPGNLYADLQTRSLWLGVNTAVDASGSVLISDMVAVMAEIAQTEIDAKAYTDLMLAGDPTAAPPVVGYAKTKDPIFTGNPQAPTPPPGDNDLSIATTAFVNAAIAASTTGKERRYTVLMYAGPPANIGSGDWAGWALCDGTAYPNQPNPAGGTMTVTTPDLRSKFVLGSGPIPQWPAAGSASLMTAAPTQPGGAHNHGGNTGSVTLSAAQIPAHSHTSGTLAGTVAGSTDTEPSHTHTVTLPMTSNSWAIGAGGPPTAYSNNSGTTLVVGTSSGGSHAHALVGATCDVSSGSTANNVGGGGSHLHTIGNATDHTHVTNSNDVRNALPWLALAYVMKL